MQENIEKLEAIRTEIIHVLSKVKPDDRTRITSDSWNIKDIISHLNNWLVLDIDHLESLKQSKEAYWEPDMEKFNTGGVAQRKTRDWQDVRQEFSQLNQKIIDLYRSLSEDLWHKTFTKTHSLTPEESLKEEINHWNHHFKSIQFGLK